MPDTAYCSTCRTQYAYAFERCNCPYTPPTGGVRIDPNSWLYKDIMKASAAVARMKREGRIK